MKKAFPFLASLAVLVFVGGLCTQPVENEATNASPDNNVVQGEDGGLAPDSLVEPTKTEEEAAALVQTAELEGVGGFEGSGQAARFYEGEYVLNVEAGLPDPPVGFFYEAWLRDGGGERVSVGKMEKAGAVYMLEYNSERNMDGYGTVIVSQETEESGQDGKMETEVLEGNFN